MLCVSVIRQVVNKELNFVGKAGEKSRMTNVVPSNNRNEADKFKNESAEQISLFQT